MKTFNQSVFQLIVLLLIAATSCKKTTLHPSEQSFSSANVQNVSSNKAVPFKFQNRIDLSNPRYIEFNSCTGEIINIKQGILQIDVNGVINGDNISYDLHSNTSNYKLINLTTGLEYTGCYVANISMNNYFNAIYEVTTTVTILLTTPGGGNNSILKGDYHMTVDSNGNVTASVDNFRGGCR
ncbi:MAG TPA: hypothetical protein VN958_06170 [Chitinophagaceae bacterium]|nr:hypothetical protein [Chitinophagaceae bacterium]